MPWIRFSFLLVPHCAGTPPTSPLSPAVPGRYRQLQSSCVGKHSLIVLIKHDPEPASKHRHCARHRLTPGREVPQLAHTKLCQRCPRHPFQTYYGASVHAGTKALGHQRRFTKQLRQISVVHGALPLERCKVKTDSMLPTLHCSLDGEIEVAGFIHASAGCTRCRRRIQCVRSLL